MGDFEPFLSTNNYKIQINILYNSKEGDDTNTNTDELNSNYYIIDNMQDILLEEFSNKKIYDDFQRILQLLPENNEHQISLKKHMLGSANLIENSVKNNERIQILKEYLTELDRRRNTNWREVFPWLTEF